MAFFDKYPYTDFHELNLDWILRTIKDAEKKIDDFTAFNTITWAGEWNVTKSYVKWSIVQDTDGNGYISIQPVPKNVPLDNDKYWKKIANYETLYATFNERIEYLEKTKYSDNERIEYLEKTKHSEPINVLYLDIDNTGSKDVSDKINEYTKKYSLYFPVGYYRVDKPIYLEHSICGAFSGFESRFEANPRKLSVFTSYINTGDPNIGVINIVCNEKSDSSITVERIKITTHSKECGIFASSTIDNKLNLYNINVNVAPNGIYGFNLMGHGSENLRCVGLSAIREASTSEDDYKAGTGIIATGRDCVFNDINIFGFYSGFIFKNSPGSFLRNAHIWSGDYAVANQNVQARGIVNENGSIFCESLYIDECKYPLITSGDTSRFFIDQIYTIGAEYIDNSVKANIGQIVFENGVSGNVIRHISGTNVTYSTPPVIMTDGFDPSADFNNVFANLSQTSVYTMPYKTTGNTWFKIADAFFCDYFEFYITVGANVNKVVCSTLKNQYTVDVICGNRLTLKYKFDGSTNRSQIFLFTGANESTAVINISPSAAFITTPNSRIDYRTGKTILETANESDLKDFDR